MAAKGMLVYLDESLYRKFRSKLASEGKTVKEVIHHFISLYVGVNDEEGEKKRVVKGKDSRRDSEVAKNG